MEEQEYEKIGQKQNKWQNGSPISTNAKKLH